eukprot:1393914-Pleurochrysis_carterae.AAC.5
MDLLQIALSFCKKCYTQLTADDYTQLTADYYTQLTAVDMSEASLRSTMYITEHVYAVPVHCKLSRPRQDESESNRSVLKTPNASRDLDVVRQACLEGLSEGPDRLKQHRVGDGQSVVEVAQRLCALGLRCRLRLRRREGGRVRWPRAHATRTHERSRKCRRVCAEGCRSRS